MSHSKVRDEKSCLNCGAPVPGRYCANCGQENLEPKQTVWHLVNHFFSDVTHFDGKFFLTVKDLFQKPGFLSTEYVKGKRVSYLDPIRMYIFTSAFFFLIFFSIVNLHELEKAGMSGVGNIEQLKKKALAVAKTHDDSVSISTAFDESEKEIEKNDHSLFSRSRHEAKRKTDSAGRAADSIDAAKQRREDSLDDLKDRRKDSIDDVKERVKDSIEAQMKRDPRAGDSLRPKHEDNVLSFDSDDSSEQYTSVEQYDSAQAALPESRRHGWLKRLIKRKVIEVNAKWRGNHSGMLQEWAAAFLHNFPKALWISLPMFALLLKLLYVRRKQFYYVDHGIFAIHLYIYTFIVLLAVFGLSKLRDITGWSVVGWVEAIALFYPLWYYYKAMRRFYGQGRGKTLAKYLLLLLLSMIFQMILFALFLLFSIAQT